MTALDARSYANSPAVQFIVARNAADVAARQAQVAREAMARVEQLEAQAAAIAAQARAEEEHAAAAEHEQRVQRAIVALAEKHLAHHPNV